MVYKNGYLQVGITGYYFIYSQIYYSDGKSSYCGHEMYIDDREVLKAVYSVINKRRRYQTQYTSGIFFIKKNQKISVGTTITRTYFFRESSSFFGAFLLHRWWRYINSVPKRCIYGCRVWAVIFTSICLYISQYSGQYIL